MERLFEAFERGVMGGLFWGGLLLIGALLLLSSGKRD